MQRRNLHRDPHNDHQLRTLTSEAPDTTALLEPSESSPPMTKQSRRRIARVLLTLGCLIAALAGPVTIAAADEQQPVKLSLNPVDQPGSYFNLTIDPGQSRQLKAALGNNGSAAIPARTTPLTPTPSSTEDSVRKTGTAPQPGPRPGFRTPPRSCSCPPVRPTSAPSPCPCPRAPHPGNTSAALSWKTTSRSRAQDPLS